MQSEKEKQVRVDDNFQVKDGNYTRVHNRILEQLARVQLSGYEIRIILALWRKTYGWQKKEDFISFKQFKKMTQLPKSEVSRTLSRLKKRNLVVETYNSNRRMYRFNKHFTTWKKLAKSTTSCKNLQQGMEKSTTTDVKIYNQKSPEQAKTDQQRPPKETLTKETLTKEKTLVRRSKNVAEIFSFWKAQLNHPKALLTKDRQTKISARLKEGYTIKQCKNAIEGCKLSAYHMGDNPQGTVYDSIELIFRNGDKIEQFINIYKEVLKHGKTGKKGKRDPRKGWKESPKYSHLYRK